MHRRDLLKSAVLAAVALAVPVRRAAAAGSARLVASPANRGTAEPAVLEHGFVGVTRDGRFVVHLTKHEMGQGTSTAVPQIVAHELGFAPDDVALLFADGSVDPAYSGGAGGSTSTMGQWKPLREAAAGLRMRLFEAARTVLAVPAPSLLTLTPQAVAAASGRSVAIVALLEAARAVELAAPVVLRTDEIRSESLGVAAKRRGIEQIVTGAYGYGLDASVPGQKVAMVLRAPTRNAKWQSDNRAEVAKLPGITAVFDVVHPAPKEPSQLVLRAGVAIVGDDTWSVMKARRALKVEWDRAADADWNVAKLEAVALERAAKPRDALGERGTAPTPQRGDRVIEADYVYPYQLHQLMEPLNAIAHHRADGVTVWMGVQAPAGVINNIARRYPFTTEQIAVHTFPSGGGFGRRFYPDPALEAVAISKRAGDVPVKLVWSREDEIQFDLCHFFQHARYRAVLRGDAIASWVERTQRTFFGDGEKLPWFGYDIAHVRAEGEAMEPISPVSSGAWRSVVGNSHAFGQEGVIDEIAQALGQDPIALRRRLLAVLEAVARMQAAAPARDGEVAGVATHAYLHGNCYIATVAFAKRIDGQPRVTRVLCAADVGLVVNPSQVEAQVAGGVVWGLSALYHGNVRVEAGEVMNRNYADSPILRGSEMPAIEVEIIASRMATPCGVGELSPPSIVPAAANAISRLVGARIRRLPLAAGLAEAAARA